MNSRVPLLFSLGLSLLGCSDGDKLPAQQPEQVVSERLAPGVRRLSSPELDAAAANLLGTEIGLSQKIPPDARQNDYSRNEAQTVDSLTLSSLYDAAEAATSTLDLGHAPFPSCAKTAAVGDQACESATIAALARLAFRRVASDAELAQLQALFDLGASGQMFGDGVAVVLRALLASPKFLYATTLGASMPSGDVALSDEELASELAFLISGTPPDDALLDAAARGELRSGASREAQAIRLMQQSGSRFLYRRFVEEWLGIVRLSGLAKSSSVVNDWTALRGAMLDETNAFIDDIFAQQNGSISMLFAGGYSIIPSGLAAFYGIEPTPPGARVALDRLGRSGILQQASFLATFAHEDESAPVLRGKAVLIRVLCQHITLPEELGLDVHLPPPDPTATTRERFAAHALDPQCAQCHNALDGVGFTFEDFDAVGRFRSHENGKPIDTSGSVNFDGQTLQLADSVALSRALATSIDAQQCAARQVVRFAAGQTDVKVEDAFADAMQTAPVERRASLTGLFLEFVKSDVFAWRRSP
ncbi:MAG TPA: DUF1592 domain-containing protein [Polyangiaceae bacterium]|jgi:hypothetical protein